MATKDRSILQQIKKKKDPDKRRALAIEWAHSLDHELNATVERMRKAEARHDLSAMSDALTQMIAIVEKKLPALVRIIEILTRQDDTKSESPS
ncbi:MAG: hypothetical protein LBV29_06905 [Azoarcus sp.]|jgi:demethoxyubiquinone hydroxylase (CLK1/Coq7/Cat5 family)|nr:hypothetical protein [Azoarcus sp.]